MIKIIRSHPTRVRGLKPVEYGATARNQSVAPHAGAWIETCSVIWSSHKDNVAPHAGAWIETLYKYQIYANLYVAPHAGAWIETLFEGPDDECSMSHPTRVRGLKQYCREAERFGGSVAPHAGAWIET